MFELYLTDSFQREVIHSSGGCESSKNKTRKDMALSAISMNSALADKEFVLSLHHKLHVSTCINKPTSSPAKVSSYLPFDKIAYRNPWNDKMQTE